MKIFDGVELKPAMSQTMQGAISWALLIANTLIEAGNCRDERQAREAGTTRPTTLEQVMQQSGLRIPGIEEALQELMGGTEEAKQAAELLINNPDPAVLLQKFAEHFGLTIMTEPAAPAAAAAPQASASTTPPSTSCPPFGSSRPVPPTMAAPAASATPHSRPDLTHKARVATPYPMDAPALRPPQFRADFTREAREAVKATASASPPESTSKSPESADSRASLVEMVERQLGALRRRMEMHQAEIDERIGHAESELGALRERLRELLTAPRPRAREPVPATMAAAFEVPTVVEPRVASARDSTPERQPPAAETGGGSAVERFEDVAEPLPLVATENEVVHAVELVGAFGDEVEAQHRQSTTRLSRVEHELHVMRDLVARAEEVAQSEEAGAASG